MRFLVFLGWTWRVVANLISLLIVFYIFSRLQNRFEIVVVSILGFIYLTMRATAFRQVLTTIAMGKALNTEFERVRALLGEDLTSHRADVAEATKASDRLVAKGYLDMTFASIISLICLFQFFTHL